MKSNKINKIKDWFIITRIRILNFIKEHKYVSAIVGIFLASAVIAFAVRALTNETINNAVATVTDFKVTTEGDERIAPNFSRVTYSLTYSLDQGNKCSTSGDEEVVYQSDQVEIIATLPDGVQAEWLGTDETAHSIINGKQLNVIVSPVNMCSSQTQIFSLMVLNAEKNSNIKPTVSIKGGSASEVVPVNSDSVGVTTSYDKEYALTPLVKSGIAKKINSSGDRDVKFGILLGVEVDSTADDVSLKGSYLKTSADVTLIASQGQTPEYLEIYTSNENGDYYGVNESRKQFFTEGNLPDLSSTSGRITSLTKINSNEIKDGVDQTETTAPIVTLTGANNVEIEKYPEAMSEIYDDKARITLSNNKTVSYKEEVWKDGQKIDVINLDVIGDYTINYVVSGENNSVTTMVKKVRVVAPSNDKYSLEGEKTIYLSKGDTLKELGVFDSTSKLSTSRYTISYSKQDSQGETISKAELVKSTGTYIQTYTIKPIEEEPGIGESVTLTRTIIVVDSLPSITSDKISVQKANISAGETVNEHKFLVNGEEKTCDGSNNCSFSYNEDSNSYIYTISKETYTSKIVREINVVPSQYKLSISGILPGESLRKIKDKFYAVGAYYVTVKSPRKANDNSNFNVNLKAIVDSYSSESSVESKEYATGYETSSLTNTMYVNEDASFVAVTNSEKNGMSGDYFTAAMGEVVKMISRFEYGYDADDNISELNVKIPVNGNLIPTAYSSEISSDSSSYFLIRAIKNGSVVETLPSSSIKYCVSDSECFEPEKFDSEKQIVSYINITIKSNADKTFEITPGTTIEIGTKYIVRTFTGTSEVAGNLKDLKFNGEVFFSWVSGNNENLSKNAATPDIYITPYKIRANVGVGRNDNYNLSDTVILDASKNDNYTVYTSLNIISPAMNLTSNVFGYTRISEIPVKFELPAGVNYVYNNDYKLEPKVVDKQKDKTIITYIYSNEEPNSWIEPIYFDFNVDVATGSGEFMIKVSVGNLSSTDFSIKNDVSSIDKYKVKNKNIIIENTEHVSYGQYIYANGEYVSNIDENASFDLSIKLHNNRSTVKNLSVYTVLPYNDDEKESSFSGKYIIKALPDNAQCTTDSASMVTSEDLVSDVKWESCSKFKASDGAYSGFSAIKVSYPTFNANASLVDNKITIETRNNKPDDVYTFKSYLDYTNANNNYSGYKNFKDIELTVISKKITGVVWEDFNLDGIMDNSEKKIESVILSLYDATSDQLVNTTTPNKDGVYTFSALAKGNYYIVADFNTEKYGITGMPSEDFYDKTRLSVFKSEVISSEEYEKYEIDEDDDEEEDDDFDDDYEEEKPEFMSIVKTDTITVGSETRIIRYQNLGLSLRKKFKIKVNKYVTRAEVTNALGVVTIKDYGNTKLAKLDVKDINNLKIKVVFTIEIQNIKYYPGYVSLVTDVIPDGMSFNPNYAENAGWELDEDGRLVNRTLADELIEENEKKYLTVAFDITRKEAGSFINFASVDQLQILGGISDEE